MTYLPLLTGIFASQVASDPEQRPTRERRSLVGPGAQAAAAAADGGLEVPVHDVAARARPTPTRCTPTPSRGSPRPPGASAPPPPPPRRRSPRAGAPRRAGTTTRGARSSCTIRLTSWRLRSSASRPAVLAAMVGAAAGSFGGLASEFAELDGDDHLVLDGDGALGAGLEDEHQRAAAAAAGGKVGEEAAAAERRPRRRRGTPAARR